MFLTNKGLFKLHVMYFGLCNSLGTFQRMMNSIFWELLHEGVLVNYMDDFIIPAKTWRNWKKNDQILEDSRETQSVFQEIEMQFQHGRNPYPRSHCREGTNQDEIGEDKGSKRMENTNESERHGKFPRVCKLLLTIHPKLQPHGKAIERIERQEGLEVGRRTPKGI